MSKLGVITDGISRDLSHAISVMSEYGLEYAELQFIGDKEVGDLTPTERKDVTQLLSDNGKTVSCISRHLFAGMLMGSSEVGDALHTKHMDALKRCIEMAQENNCNIVRIMSGKKEMILWGSHGAEQWNVAKGAWDKQLELFAPVVELARNENIKLVTETGNGLMIHSAWTGVKLIDDLNAKDVLGVLWDPANACYGHEVAYPDAYDLMKEGYIGHVHIKDVQVNTPRAHLEVRPMGQGQLGEQLPQIGAALNADNYEGIISFESVYHPGNGDYEAGFRQNISKFIDWFS